FRPVQLVHRPVGEGGVIEPSGPDEMTLLQRLIDYGIVTGMSSPGDVTLLEDSQGDRKPRSSYELTAQGYLLGNCSHCHNPRGFPSVQFPVLKDVLSFLPGPQGSDGDFAGGIFQFPLEKYSPRIFRGEAGLLPLPYVTPSLLDHPEWPADVLKNPDPNVGDYDNTSKLFLYWRPKWFPFGIGDNPPTSTVGFAYAPWRSLVYRNVDTPFTYADDFALYPHMPMNTAGFDPRAKQILGDWMTSIPAARKRPEIPEYQQPYPDPRLDPSGNPTWPDYADDSPQPYVEVLQGAAGYDAAILAAQQRLAILHAGSRPGEKHDVDVPYRGRYDAVPDTSDIVDPTVDGVTTFVPGPVDIPNINIPTHAHWVVLDLTAPAGAWVPRRGDWKDVLVDTGNVTQTAPFGNLADVQHVVDVILGHAGDAGTSSSGARLDATIRQFALTPNPMGLWLEKPQCDWSKPPLSATPTLDQARAADHRPWMDYHDSSEGGRHVYATTPGAYVFNQICANCHGANADSKGRLADNLANVTGGNAIVADFRDGLFGPRTAPGQYRSAVFAPAAQAVGGLSADDWAARYMAFMALGGTEKIIPPAFLTIVSHTAIFGEIRKQPLPPPNQANMLTNARQLCLSSLASPPYDFSGQPGRGHLQRDDGVEVLAGRFPRNLHLEFDNGDAELWLRLCSINNPPPIISYEHFPAGSRELGQGTPVPFFIAEGAYETGSPTGLPQVPYAYARTPFLAA
ncbi:MAG: hypothetical protein JOZ69_03480, partial [Myxococcales bacterium]|nr:hypothetical protein [Myxococcales bacterium]